MKHTTAFSDNLKYYREKRGLTQRQLAERIGYTEKSISKWESGGGLPSLLIAQQLSILLGVSLDEMLHEGTSQRYYLGIDGGGTKTIFKLTDESGAAVRIVCKGAVNPNDIGMDNACDVLREGILEVCGDIPRARITLFAGISGGGLTGNNAALLHAFFARFGFYAFQNGSDIDNLIALAEHRPCILVIMGTGFIVYSLQEQHQQRLAGWGQLFDDGGSGYTLGRDAIHAALCALDGSGEHTILSNLLTARMGMTPQAHLSNIYAGGKRYIASFADVVFDASAQGDHIARMILQRNMAYVAHIISTAARSIPEEQNIPVLFSGSISKQSDVLFPLIRHHLADKRCILRRMEQDPVDGALEYARRLTK